MTGRLIGGSLSAVVSFNVISSLEFTPAAFSDLGPLVNIVKISKRLELAHSVDV